MSRAKADDAPAGGNQRWVVTWADVEQAQLESMLRATPEQRLAWLEEAMRLAYASGAIGQIADRTVPPIAALWPVCRNGRIREVVSPKRAMRRAMERNHRAAIVADEGAYTSTRRSRWADASPWRPWTTWLRREIPSGERPQRFEQLAHRHRPYPLVHRKAVIAGMNDIDTFEPQRVEGCNHRAGHSR